MCLGLIFFTLADSKVGAKLSLVSDSNFLKFQLTPSFDMTGVLMISLALVADAVIGNVQEKTIKQYNASNSEVADIHCSIRCHCIVTFQVVLFSYSIGFVYLFFLVAVFTDIASAIHYCSYYPKQTYGYAFIFSLTGYLGIQVEQKLPNYSWKMRELFLFRLFSAS